MKIKKCRFILVWALVLLNPTSNIFSMWPPLERAIDYHLRACQKQARKAVESIRLATMNDLFSEENRVFWSTFNIDTGLLAISLFSVPNAFNDEGILQEVGLGMIINKIAISIDSRT